MRKLRTFDEITEPDTVFGTGQFTPEDNAAIQEFIAESRNSHENRAAVAAMQQRAAQVVKVDKPLSQPKFTPTTA